MNALIAFSLRQRVLVVLMFVLMLGVGYGAYTQLNIEAYPTSWWARQATRRWT